MKFDGVKVFLSLFFLHMAGRGSRFGLVDVGFDALVRVGGEEVGVNVVEVGRAAGDVGVHFLHHFQVDSRVEGGLVFPSLLLLGRPVVRPSSLSGASTVRAFGPLVLGVPSFIPSPVAVVPFLVVVSLSEFLFLFSWPFKVDFHPVLLAHA